jgi:hypothetical protein
VRLVVSHAIVVRIASILALMKLEAILSVIPRWSLVWVFSKIWRWAELVVWKIQLLRFRSIIYSFVWSILGMREWDHFGAIKIFDLSSENIGFSDLIRRVVPIELVVPAVYFLIDNVSVLLPDLLIFEGELVFLAHLILNGWVIILPIEFEVALHVVQCLIGFEVRNPRYIFRLCTLVPFLSRNISILQFYYLLHDQ